MTLAGRPGIGGDATGPAAAAGRATPAEAAGCAIPGLAPEAVPVLAPGFAPEGAPGLDTIRHDRASQLRGIVLLLGSVLSFTLMDATGKYLTQTYNPGMIVWARFAGAAAILLVIFGGRLRATLATQRPMMQTARALTQLASIGLFMSSLAYIGLAEATAIMDVNPVLITLFAAIFLGERIGIRRIAGIVAALIGAMIVIRPGSGVLHPAAILPLIGAFTYAAGAILTRLVRADRTATSILWTALIGAGATSLLLPWVWQPMATGDLWAFGAIGIFGTIAQVLLVRALSLAEASAIAPLGYTGLVWAGLWSWLFWGHIPDAWTLIGAAIIVGAGIYVWTREARAA